MTFYLHRPTPLDDWKVYVDILASPLGGIRAGDGEVIDLPDVQWFSQAQAEADRLNGKQDGGQGVLGL